MKDGLISKDETQITKQKKETYNQKMIRLTLHSETLPKIDTSDPAQVQQRVSEYLDFCMENNQLPSIVHVANWIGIHRSTLNDWKNGTPQRKEHQKIIQGFYNVCEEILVSRMMDNKVSAPVGIFMLKNWFGYSERVDIGLGAKQDPLAGLPEEEKKKRLLDMIPFGGDEIDGDGEDSDSGSSAGKD